IDSYVNCLRAKLIGVTDKALGPPISVYVACTTLFRSNFNGTADFDPGSGTYNMTSAGNNDIFIQKMDNNGNFLWAKAIGGTGIAFGIAIAVDAAGNVYAIRYFAGTADVDAGSGTYNMT